MELASVQAFTFDWPDLPLLHQGYRTRDGSVFWSLQFLHHELCAHGYSKKPYQLMASVRELLQDVPFIDVGVHTLAKPAASETAKVPHHLLTTSSVLAAITGWMSRNQTEKKIKKACAGWACCFCEAYVTYVKRKKTDITLEPGTPIVLNRLGVATGLHNESCLDRT